MHKVKAVTSDTWVVQMPPELQRSWTYTACASIPKAACGSNSFFCRWLHGSAKKPINEPKQMLQCLSVIIPGSRLSWGPDRDVVVLMFS